MTSIAKKSWWRKHYQLMFLLYHDQRKESQSKCELSFYICTPLNRCFASSVRFKFVICWINRVRTGHGKPGKSWNARISFSMPEKSCHIFPFFLFSQSSVSYFSIFLSNHAAGHAVIGPCGEKRAI